MKLVTKRPWDAIDFAADIHADARSVAIPAGEHDVELRPNPAHPHTRILVIEGTMVGATLGFWLQWGPDVLCDEPGHPNHGKFIDWGDRECLVMDDAGRLMTMGDDAKRAATSESEG